VSKTNFYQGDVPWPLAARPDVYENGVKTYYNDGIEMGPNRVWEDELLLVNYYKGRSAVNFKFRSLKTNLSYDFGLGSFFAATPYMSGRKLAGKFVWYKQGTSYLVEFLPEGA
jgi:hypothetical protein